jgi:hypothetical protein
VLTVTSDRWPMFDELPGNPCFTQLLHRKRSVGSRPLFAVLPSPRSRLGMLGLMTCSSVGQPFQPHRLHCLSTMLPWMPHGVCGVQRTGAL